MKKPYTNQTEILDDAQETGPILRRFGDFGLKQMVKPIGTNSQFESVEDWLKIYTISVVNHWHSYWILEGSENESK